ncbi:ABC transporter ATP-binding protein/permease [Chelatococcus sp. SYSU_G07232]|uniref:ABC transporter ATP-binding protein/permease n=1 Tax=Chelatococcus albus TaxID=3047466 RepID=A0ABT7AE43_9HYPH|nr:ABC transporter ATP-binding protein/permease [Chelatococcus sp. SYSU_G07232]MDJ1157074.1 ABC transporter ATP-binding protein/permease [Chelatococcus sp. SYSU_G07232]
MQPPAATTGVEKQAALAARPTEANGIQRAAARAQLRMPDARRGMLSELANLFREMLRGGQGWPILWLGAGILLVLMSNMVGQVRLNQWNGAFFDALDRRDGEAFLWQLIVFLMIVGVLLVLIVAQTWLQEMFKIRVRERVTQILLDAWLVPGRAYQLGFAGPAAAAPDQRMQEDSRLFAELTTDIGVGMLNSILLLLSFIGVLWMLSSEATFTIGGRSVVIPGYMVWVAVGYALAGSGLTWLVGRPLIRLNTERYAREAELRFALIRVNECAESVALYAGERDERRNLDRNVSAVLRAMRRLSGALSRLTWITSGYGWLAIVVPILAAAPGYFSGQLSFGELMMVVGAFTQVQQALRYFVDNFPRIADWRSAVVRVATFRDAARDFDATHDAHSRIRIVPHPQGLLAFEHLSLALNDGTAIIDEATAEVRRGERVLITGDSGAGKSTLFRAIAGLWPWGEGVIQTPPTGEMMFLPQRPYLPLGTLRAAVCYPASPDAFDDREVRRTMVRCGLGDFLDDLDAVERWDRKLSLGQQQRVAFARLLLHKPAWVFMDEATSALDEESQASFLSLFQGELASTTVLSIGHRPGLEAFHTRALHLRKMPEGGVVLKRRPEPAEPGWLSKLLQGTRVPED